MQVCDELQFKVPTFIECDRLVNRIRGSYDMFMPATLVVTDPSFFDKGMLVSRWRGKVKLLLVVREPADFLWAAYNTWTPQMADGSGLQGLGKNHSPERFDKLVLDGKKEPTKIIGKWFDPIKNLKDVSANLIVLKFEGFSDKSTTNIKKMGAFFGVDPSLFHDEVADGYTSSLAAGVPQTPMYQISGWRPMLCSTRRFIYSKTRDVCEELDSIGVHYSACLGEHDDCVDPPPGSSFPPRPAPRLRPLTPSQKGSFRLQTPAFAEGLPTMMFNGTIAPGVKQGVASMVESSPRAAEIPIFVVGLTFGGIIARLMKGR